MDYLGALQLIKRSFIGGTDWSIYHDALADFSESRCDWLEIGIGDANQVLVNLKDMFGRSGIELDLTGVDPELDLADFTRALFPCAELVTAKFEDFPITRQYDFVSAIQSFYYFSDKRRQLERAISALKPSGKLLIIHWSHEDTLHQLNRFLFSDSANGISGENIVDLLGEIGGIQVTAIKSLGAVNMQHWFDSDSQLEAAVRIISRETIGVTQMVEAKLRLRNEKHRLCANSQPRINLVIIAQRVPQ